MNPPYIRSALESIDQLCKQYGSEVVADLMVKHPDKTHLEISEELERKNNEMDGSE